MFSNLLWRWREASEMSAIGSDQLVNAFTQIEIIDNRKATWRMVNTVMRSRQKDLDPLIVRSNEETNEAKFKKPLRIALELEWIVGPNQHPQQLSQTLNQS